MPSAECFKNRQGNLANPYRVVGAFDGFAQEVQV